jgi:hypothetical protein
MEKFQAGHWTTCGHPFGSEATGSSATVARLTQDEGFEDLQRIGDRNRVLEQDYQAQERKSLQASQYGSWPLIREIHQPQDVKRRI